MARSLEARASLSLASVVALVMLAGVFTPAAAQQDAANIGTKLMTDAAVKAAVEAIKAAEPQTIEDQIRLCEIEAPPFREQKRADVYANVPRGRAADSQRALLLVTRSAGEDMGLEGLGA